MKSYVYPICLLLFACNYQSANENEGGADSTAQYEVNEGGMDAYYSSSDGIGYSESNNSYCDVKFGAYLFDPGESHTNIRSSPNGKVLMALPWSEQEEEYMVSIIASEGEWFKIESPIRGVERDYIIESEYAWVHNSVLAVDTRNYASQSIEVHEEPSETSRILSKIEQELGGLRPIKACGDWVFIQVTNGKVTHNGWVKIDWLCGNPLTTCA